MIYSRAIKGQPLWTLLKASLCTNRNQLQLHVFYKTFKRRLQKNGHVNIQKTIGCLRWDKTFFDKSKNNNNKKRRFLNVFIYYNMDVLGSRGREKLSKECEVIMVLP